MNIVEVKDLHMYFPILKGVLFHSVAGHVKAVDGVSFSIPEGETLGLVGESGSGKSTVGNMLLRLLKPTSGEILYRGRSILSLSPQEEREFRSRAQMVFQNPFASLNPRMIVGDIIGRVLRVQRPELKKDEVRERVLNGMQEVGLKVEHMTRYPHEFSGGQRQRIAIARALISDPKFVVLDEPTSALDVSVQAQILNLFKDIQKKRRLSYLFISHNLSVIRHISHRIAVMYLGNLMEFCDRRCSATRCIPTHRRCCAAFPNLTSRTRTFPTRSSRATSPAPSIRRRDAASTRAVRRRPTNAVACGRNGEK